MAEPFVQAGKAKQVFRWIELKAKREQELKMLLRTRSCRYLPDGKCSKPIDTTCAEIRCRVWEAMRW